MTVLGPSAESATVPRFRDRCLVSYGFNSPLTLVSAAARRMGRGWPGGIGAAAEHRFRGADALSGGAPCRRRVGAGRGDKSRSSPSERLVLPVGLPDLPVHLRLDAYPACFCSCSAPPPTGISIFAAGYFRRGEGTAPGLLCLQYHLFLASMGFVLLADDAYAFMVAWETMALSSYFLVTTQHRIPEIRQAGFLYLLMAHLGAIAILLSFGILQGGSWHFTFDAMRAAHLGAALGCERPSVSR